MECEGRCLAYQEGVWILHGRLGVSLKGIHKKICGIFFVLNQK